jgi:hypothetical protein
VRPLVAHNDAGRPLHVFVGACRSVFAYYYTHGTKWLERSSDPAILWIRGHLVCPLCSSLPLRRVAAVCQGERHEPRRRVPLDRPQSDTFYIDERLDEAWALWNEHTGFATAMSMIVAIYTIHEMTGGTEEQPMGIASPDLPAEVVETAGGQRRGTDAAAEAWNVIAGLLAAHNGLEDLFLQKRIATLSTSYKGTSVFLYQWFAYSALRHLERSRPEDYDAALVSLAETFEGFGPDAM